jgi:recombinational DNA repair ATPase RecF
MIKIETIRIEEFRGIRDLTLKLADKNFAICGPNGTGKSGVVDALEFALTGNISRLSGEGTDELSVKAHAPHVDSRNAVDKARVTITARIPSLNKTVAITRTVKAPNTPVISTSDPTVIAVLQQLEDHPEFVLTRRELIHYVLSPPGKRAKEIQALLRLDRINQARDMFQRVFNKCKKAVVDATENRKRSGEYLMRALGVPSLTSQELLNAVNTQRGALGLNQITELTATTSLKDGAIGVATGKNSGKISKIEAVTDMAQLRADLNECSSPETKAKFEESIQILTALIADEALVRSLTRESFFSTGLKLIDANTCPLCDTNWNPVLLRAHIEEKLARLADISKLKSRAEISLQPAIRLLQKVKDGLAVAVRYGETASPPIDLSELRNIKESIENFIQQLNNLLPLSDTVATLKRIPDLSEAILPFVSSVEAFIATIPEPTTQDAARDYLTVAQERLEAYRDASLSLRKAETQKELAERVFDIYDTVSNKVLEDLYHEVEEDFADLYRDVNRDDEASFTAHLKPSLGKLGFDVDFYGRGHFPPGAYHSEGHQDSMGLCLYLALMKHLQGTSFTFAVLDDVLMSVDAGHRREVCSLLKKRFPDTQFILTTHDQVWLRHMRTEGLLLPRSWIHFRSWNVDHGPTEWDDRDVWTEIKNYLDQNKVTEAAGLLRNFLEYMGAELCHRLRAFVEFRGDGQYQLGDVLPRATARLKELHKKGKQAAQSWKQSDAMGEITSRSDTFDQIVKESNVEQWQINPAIHYNEWATLQKEDFIPVVAAYKALSEAFQCPSSECQAFLHVLPERGTAESLRCDCGSISINLKEKE